MGISRCKLDPAIEVLDTGAYANLVSMTFLAEEMKEKFKPIIEDNMRSASNTQLKVVGLITLIVQVGSSIVPVQLGFID